MPVRKSTTFSKQARQRIQRMHRLLHPELLGEKRTIAQMKKDLEKNVRGKKATKNKQQTARVNVTKKGLLDMLATTAAHERWENLSPERKAKYEEQIQRIITNYLMSARRGDYLFAPTINGIREHNEWYQKLPKEWQKKIMGKEGAHYIRRTRTKEEMKRLVGREKKDVLENLLERNIKLSQAIYQKQEYEHAKNPFAETKQSTDLLEGLSNRASILSGVLGKWLSEEQKSHNAEFEKINKVNEVKREQQVINSQTANKQTKLEKERIERKLIRAAERVREERYNREIKKRNEALAAQEAVVRRIEDNETGPRLRRKAIASWYLLRRRRVGKTITAIRRDMGNSVQKLFRRKPNSGDEGK